MGIDSTGNLYELPVKQSSGGSKWVKLAAPRYPGVAIKALAVRTAKEVYAIYQGSYCANQLHRWNGTSWANINNCFDEIDVTTDGALYAINHAGLYYSTNPTGATPTFTFFGPGWLHFAGVNNNLAYASTKPVAFKNYFALVNISANTSTTVTGLPSGAVPASFKVTSDNKLWIKSIAGSYGTLYVYDLNDPAAVWVNLSGQSYTAVFGNLSSDLFAINSTGTPFHYLTTRLMATETVTGYYDCTGMPNNQCPQGSLHTATATVGFPSSPTVSNQVAGAPASYLNVSATGIANMCDPIFGDPFLYNCQVATGTGGVVTCPMMGRLFAANDEGSGPSWSTETETASTKFLNTGLHAGGGCVPNMFGEVCSWNVAPTCSNTSNPDYRFPGGPPPDAWIRDYDFEAWDSKAECLRLNFNGLHTPWMCQNLIVFTIGTSDTTPSNSCTYNP